MPMTLRARHEQAGRERALMGANCVALAADEVTANSSGRRQESTLVVTSWTSKNPRVGEQTWE